MRFIVLSGLWLLAACGNNASTDATNIDSAVANTDHLLPKADTVAVQVSAELYSGILPCADCEGIETSIELGSDGKFNKHLLFIGRQSKGAGSNEFSETGKWTLQGMDTVYLADLKDNGTMYLRTDSSLIQLDMSGKRITGKLAGKYELKKKVIK